MHRQLIRRPALAIGLAGVVILGGALGCGGGGDELTVGAAASLAGALGTYAESVPGEERFSFGGSGQLAAQIRQGARPDVFASANLRYPRELAELGLVEEPVGFARNRLVIAAPPGSEIGSLTDLAEPGVELVVGVPSAPIGQYTRDLLADLPAAVRAAIEANVRSTEADVKGVVGKVAQGAADAGFVYASDIAAASEDLRAIELPPRLRPPVEYAVAVLADAEQPALAREFVAGLLAQPGRRALRAAGLRPAGGP